MDPPRAGVYTGTFPCHDCPGIDTTLWLRPDGRFFIRQEYRASGDGAVIDAYGLGRWHIDRADDALVLAGEGPGRIFRREGADMLVLQTNSDLEHRLSRVDETTRFASSIRLTGTIRLEAGDPVFVECLTGYVLPVRESGDVARFRHQYRGAGARGASVFVEFVGRFHWTEEGAPQSVTIERFGTIRENDECRTSEGRGATGGPRIGG